jgi:hypothetical protein
VLRHNVDLPLHLERKIHHELHGDNKRNTCKRRGEKERRMRSSLGREGVWGGEGVRKRRSLGSEVVKKRRIEEEKDWGREEVRKIRSVRKILWLI